MVPWRCSISWSLQAWGSGTPKGQKEVTSRGIKAS